MRKKKDVVRKFIFLVLFNFDKVKFNLKLDFFILFFFFIIN